MSSARRRVLDAVFLFAFIGLPVFGLWFLLRCVRFLFGSDEDFSPSLPWRVTWVVLVVLWSFIAVFAVSDLLVRKRRDQEVAPWWRVLAQHFLVMGPTAYYLGVARPAMGPVVKVGTRKRALLRLLDALTVMTSWAPILLLGIFCSLIVLPMSLRLAPAIALAFATLIVIPNFVIYPLLQVLFMTHAMRRFGELPMSLTPWAWVFGQRRYYRRALRPELVEAGPQWEL